MRFVRLLVMFVAVSASTLAVGTSPAVAASVHLHARLLGSTSYPAARGSADYDTWCCGREIDVDVWNLSSLAGRTLAVYAGGTNVGTATVSSGGSFHFHRRGSGVPRLVAGDRVSVKRLSGTVVASGTLKRMCC